jgi:gamma-glutamylcyclotransferase (GGCT)/AIG2-like uncharacterized protein YtfP
MTALANQYLFLYGTLLPGLAPPVIAAAVGRLRRVGRGLVRGRLYDFGRYPGVVLAERGPRVQGEVFALPQDPEVLRRLDRYEGFLPGSPARSEFVRRSWPVTVPGRETLMCWVYEYARPPGQAALILGGNYLRLVRQRAQRPPGRV